MQTGSPIRFLNLEYFFGWLSQSWANFIDGLGGSSFSPDGFLRVMGILISLIVVGFVAFVAYLYIRRREQESERQERISSYFITHEDTEQKTNERWEIIERHFQSSNESEWRIAIIEADAMLDELFLTLGYSGASLGERMKSASPSDFPKIQQAWEAHKMRNRIAHEGFNYKIEHADAMRAWKLYENVFVDGGVI
ncbi:MAG: hypothetical protein OEX08_01220 [Candidatus Nomurabacteria bacterium]|nr:hypothetical protein [Candidatus Nomurabacteria bacterium]